LPAHKAAGVFKDIYDSFYSGENNNSSNIDLTTTFNKLYLNKIVDKQF